MTSFIAIWISQIFSILCSGMTQFGLTIWMYRQTHSATAMALMSSFYITPFLLVTPLAGVLVDRYNRKLMMMVSDLAGVTATAAILVLFATGRFEFWHLYITSILTGLGGAFSGPAYNAVVVTMVPKEQLGRVNGLLSLMGSGPGVVSPLLAGALLPIIGLAWILTFDVISFIIAILILALVIIPQPVRTVVGKATQARFLRESQDGFSYILKRPGLLGLELIFLFGNFFWNMAIFLLAPMVLARTQQNNLIFGTVQTSGALGGVAGGLVMSAWGGFKRRMRGVLAGWLFLGLVGTVLIGLPFGLLVWAAGMAVSIFASPIIDSHNQSIWQAKVPQDLQGRVFSAQTLIAYFTGPVIPVIAGLMADRVFEPAMLGGGWLPGATGWLVGSGPGAGTGLFMILCGFCVAAVVFVAGSIPAIRNIEDLIPDQTPVSGKVSPDFAPDEASLPLAENNPAP